jgi:hypothetical protein
MSEYPEFVPVATYEDGLPDSKVLEERITKKIEFMKIDSTKDVKNISNDLNSDLRNYIQ